MEKNRIIPMLMKLRLLLFCAAFSACASVTAEMGAKEGIPLYAPRPYLLITKNMRFEKNANSKSSRKQSPNDQTNIDTSGLYSVRVIYLPDLSLKYGLIIKSGFGSVTTKVALSDGWKLNGINFQSDSKVPEILGAVANIVKNVVTPNLEAIRASTNMATGSPQSSLELYEMEISSGTVNFQRVFKWPAPLTNTP